MLQRARRGVERYVRSVPGTYLWLLILLVTTVIQRRGDAARGRSRTWAGGAPPPFG